MVIRRADALANQARVLEAARQVFAEQGLAAEVKDIAERAGVGVATIYRGFGSKNELLQATIEQADLRVSDLLAVAESEDDPAEGLRVLINGMLGFAESYGWLIQASLAGDEVTRQQSSLKDSEQHQRRTFRLIQQAIERGVLPADLPADVVKLMIEGAVIALTFRARRQRPRPASSAIADGLVGLLTGSLASKNAT